MATDYDELRSEVKESQNDSLEALTSASAPDANSVVRELDAADDMDNVGIPGGEFVADELIVQVVPQRNDEFTCYSCFLAATAPKWRGRKTVTPTASSARAEFKDRKPATPWEKLVGTGSAPAGASHVRSPVSGRAQRFGVGAYYGRESSSFHRFGGG